MMMPQATEQYGQVLRVSRICASLKGRTAAAMAGSRPPKPERAERAAREAGAGPLEQATP